MLTNLTFLNFGMFYTCIPSFLRSNSALSTSSNVSYVSTPLSSRHSSQQQESFFSSISSDLNVLASQTSYMLGDWLGKMRGEGGKLRSMLFTQP